MNIQTSSKCTPSGWFKKKRAPFWNPFALSRINLLPVYLVINLAPAQLIFQLV
jgi:hypothetical protein